MKASERKERVKKLHGRVNDLLKVPEVIAYTKWVKLDEAQKAIIILKWKQFYADARKTVSYFDYQEAREALRNNNIDKVKEIARRARDRKLENKYPPQPSSFDPNLLIKDMLVQSYIKTTEELVELSKYVSLNAEEIFV